MSMSGSLGFDWELLDVVGLKPGGTCFQMLCREKLDLLHRYCVEKKTKRETPKDGVSGMLFLMMVLYIYYWCENTHWIMGHGLDQKYQGWISVGPVWP